MRYLYWIVFSYPLLGTVFSASTSTAKTINHATGTLTQSNKLDGLLIPTHLDREKVGRPVLVITHVKLPKQTTKELRDFGKHVCALAEVHNYLHVSGDWNFILHVTAVMPQAYFRFFKSKINNLSNVSLTASIFVLKEATRNPPSIL